MYSKRIQHVFNVCATLKTNILNDISNGIERTVDEVEEMTRVAFKDVAKNANITESTVRDACTRRMEMNTEQFYNSVKNRLINGESDTELLDAMISHGTTDDDPTEIRVAMKKIF